MKCGDELRWRDCFTEFARVKTATYGVDAEEHFRDNCVAAGLILLWIREKWEDWYEWCKNVLASKEDLTSEEMGVT